MEKARSYGMMVQVILGNEMMGVTMEKFNKKPNAFKEAEKNLFNSLSY